jgi:hypothetical protein
VDGGQPSEGCDELEGGSFEVLEPGESTTFSSDGEIDPSAGESFQLRFAYKSPEYSSDEEQWVSCDSDWTNLCASQYSGTVELGWAPSSTTPEVTVLASDILGGAPVGMGGLPL